MTVGASLMRMLPLDIQVAFRDAEKELSNWCHSPLRQLVAELAGQLNEEAREEIQDQVTFPAANRLGYMRAC
jgi:putative ATP-dependent endonuclease of the OLD family